MMRNDAEVNTTDHSDAPTMDRRGETAALRALLFADESRRIERLEERLDEKEIEWRDLARRSEATSEVLVDSVRITSDRDGRLSEALRPEVEKGLRQSIRDNPEVMADALYPVLGPAVRKLIANLIQPDVSGKSDVYRVEQLFVIHRETSLVLAHMTFDDSLANDADVVSGMLDAIRSFVQDAFEAQDFDGMESLTVGDITVLVEWGPEAVLAAVVRGFAPDGLRAACAETLRQIHLENADVLEAFDGGDLAPFEHLDVKLADAVQPFCQRSSSSRDTASHRLWLAAGLVASLFAGITLFAHSYTNERVFTLLVDELGKVPGVVVVNAERDGARVKLSALRDPLGDSPEALLATPQFLELSIQSEWIPFLSLDDEMIVRRVQRHVPPALAASVQLRDGVVTLPDHVPMAQRDALVTRLSYLSGVLAVRFGATDTLTTTTDASQQQ